MASSGIIGAITGRAIYEGSLDLAAALLRLNDEVGLPLLELYDIAPQVHPDRPAPQQHHENAEELEEGVEVPLEGTL